MKGIDCILFVASFIVEVDLSCVCLSSLSFTNAAFPMCPESMVIILSLNAVHPERNLLIYGRYQHITIAILQTLKSVKVEPQVIFIWWLIPRWTNGWIVQRGCSFNTEASNYFKQVKICPSTCIQMLLIVCIAQFTNWVLIINLPSPANHCQPSMTVLMLLNCLVWNEMKDRWITIHHSTTFLHFLAVGKVQQPPTSHFVGDIIFTKNVLMWNLKIKFGQLKLSTISPNKIEPFPNEQTGFMYVQDIYFVNWSFQCRNHKVVLKLWIQSVWKIWNGYKRRRFWEDRVIKVWFAHAPRRYEIQQ